MTLDEIMRTNGTCRYYTTGPVDDDALRRVLDGARWAPTGGNRQPLRFIAVRDPAKKRRLKALYLPLWNDFLNAINAGEKQYDAMFSAYGGYNFPDTANRFHFQRIANPQTLSSLISIMAGFHRFRPFYVDRPNEFAGPKDVRNEAHRRAA